MSRSSGLLAQIPRPGGFPPVSSAVRRREPRLFLVGLPLHRLSPNHQLLLLAALVGTPGAGSGWPREGPGEVVEVFNLPFAIWMQRVNWSLVHLLYSVSMESDPQTSFCDAPATSHFSLWEKPPTQPAASASLGRIPEVLTSSILAAALQERVLYVPGFRYTGDLVPDRDLDPTRRLC